MSFNIAPISELSFTRHRSGPYSSLLQLITLQIRYSEPGANGCDLSSRLALLPQSIQGQSLWETLLLPKGSEADAASILSGETSGRWADV
jgi:hypothetical protein